MLNLAKINTFEEIEPILESVEHKAKNADISEINTTNYMLSHIVREYWSYGLKDIARTISNAQADICFPYSTIDSMSNALNNVKLGR